MVALTLSPEIENLESYALHDAGAEWIPPFVLHLQSSCFALTGGFDFLGVLGVTGVHTRIPTPALAPPVRRKGDKAYIPLAHGGYTEATRREGLYS